MTDHTLSPSASTSNTTTVPTAGSPLGIAVNPVTGEKLGEFECAGDAEAIAAVERAHAAQPAWEAAGVQQRIEVLRRFQRLLHAKKEEVARLITQEAGKPYVEALVNEVVVALDATRFCAEQAPWSLFPQPVPHGNPIMRAKAGRLLRRAHGVVGIISPWNFPFSTPAGELVAALVMGNAVVLKPSEFTPLSALELQSLFTAAGLPEDSGPALALRVAHYVLTIGPALAIVLRRAPLDPLS
jgi:succinate-semialdehyde dehydrogenase/glutarate-semialdehyde dehydrogenase